MFIRQRINEDIDRYGTFFLGETIREPTNRSCSPFARAGSNRGLLLGDQTGPGKDQRKPGSVSTAGFSLEVSYALRSEGVGDAGRKIITI